MDLFSKYIQTGDWKNEKHVPVIHVPEEIKSGEAFDIKISIGDAIAHPNTLEHHIAWFKVFYLAKGAKFPVELATLNFTAHGEGENFTDPVGSVHATLAKPGTIYAVSYCNIHGLWANSVNIEF